MHGGSRDEAVLGSWRRCLDHHRLDPARTFEAVIVPEGQLRQHQEESEPLIRIARSGLERLYHHFHGQRASGHQIVERFEAHEPDAVATVDCWLEIMAAGLATAISVVDPEVVVLGGGLSGLPTLYQQLPLRLPGHLLPGVALPAIRQARFGGAGGVRGAALLNL